ncbi:hypothetical protein SAMN05446935_8395 [Burkholderia sp. YR290]|nr:hypothetical protein SAMN05446935_8395 [Burkholderia sp. YR290]
MATRSRYSRKQSAVLALASVAFGGCASDRLADTAGDAAKYVSAFQSDLMTLQGQLTENQKVGAAYDAEYTTSTSISEATSGQAAKALALLSCPTPAAVFTALQSQGSAATAGELATTAATTSTPIATLPTDKLAAVASGLTALAKKPGKKENVEFLLAYGQSVNASMKAPTAGRPASGAPAADAPASGTPPTKTNPPAEPAKPGATK